MTPIEVMLSVLTRISSFLFLGLFDFLFLFSEWPHTLPLLPEHQINFLDPGEMFIFRKLAIKESHHFFCGIGF